MVSRRVAALSSTSTRSPFLVKSGSSKLAVSVPCSAFWKTSSTESRYSAVMNSLTSERPSTSSRLNPVISAALRFHSLTIPPASMPKIGAFAVSMSSVRSLATRWSSACEPWTSGATSTTPSMPRPAPAASLSGTALRLIGDFFVPAAFVSGIGRFWTE